MMPGMWGPALFIGGYALAELAFVPALPLTLLGGLIFGPVRGTIIVSIGATLARRSPSWPPATLPGG